MPGPTRIVVDQWSALSHKQIVGDGTTQTAGSRIAPTWVPETERRRLAAYLARAAYMGNVARQLLPDDTTQGRRDAHREYGDADLLVDRVVAGVLGDWTVTVDGADGDLTPPVLPDQPQEAPADASDLEKRLAKIAQDAWLVEATAIVDAWEATVADLPAARERETAVRDWLDKAQGPARVNEGEHDAAGLGDTVYVLWPTAGGWPTIQVLDPGFYFPELPDDGGAGEFPGRLHFCWDYDRTLEDGRVEKWTRRQTFELVDIAATRIGADARGEPVWLGADGMEADQPWLNTTETVGADGRIYRAYPWHEEGDPLSPLTCLYTDAAWRTSDVQGDVYQPWPIDRAEVTRWRHDMGCDFLPVVHVPCTPTGKDHYGRSVIDAGAQILDDLASADTSTVGASKYLGDPTIALAGATATNSSVLTPGTILNLGPDGRMDVLDLSAGLEKLMAHGDRLQDRFWQTSRVPQEMLGRADSTAPITGVALALKFAPFAQVVAVMRIVRAPKYELLYRMGQRLAQIAGVLDSGPTPRCRMVFGNFLPTNQAETVELVASALTAHAMSTHTAVLMLVAAGLPIDDARLEVDRIRAENPEAAKAIADATNSEQLAADYLGLELPVSVATVAPKLTLPTTPPAAGA